MATPIPGGGSGDFANLREVDGFVEIPQGHTNCKAGETYPFIEFRGAY
jgi:molybdopterin molybdotransferase